LSLIVPHGVFAQGETTLVNLSSMGERGNRNSYEASISSDGRYVAFDSSADNLVTNDSNGSRDVFVHDRKTRQTTRVSVSSADVQGNSYSNQPAISFYGRYVAFDSDADNLVDSDNNGANDVFVRDREAGQTTRVSLSSSGSEGNGASYSSSISSDGRYVAFFSDASNLVDSDSNGSSDVFVHDRQTGETSRVNVSSAGAQGNSTFYYPSVPSISSDGRYVAFGSDATNLVANDSNGLSDTFVHDRQTGQTTRVSISSAGAQGTTSGFSLGSLAQSISSGGQHVAFSSWADNLVANDNNNAGDVFVHDRQTGQTSRVSVSSSGVEGNWKSDGPSISSDGQYVAFDSAADNLVLMPGETSNTNDVYVHDRFPQSARNTQPHVPILLLDY
jgi:Tol biopolymer transport system component